MHTGPLVSVSTHDDPYSHSDGSVHEFKCFSLLKYAGDGFWSYEEDLFDPGDMEAAIAGWVAAKAAAQ